MMHIHKTNQIAFVVWLRVISVFLILLCHLTQHHSNTYVVMTSQILNVGVNIFIVISGFLFGRLGVSRPYGKWFQKRARRVIYPYWVFLGTISLIHLVQGGMIPFVPFVKAVLGIHGFAYLFSGFEHTWFVTAILLCYLLTPLIDGLVSVCMKNKSYMIILVCVLAAAPLGIAFLPEHTIIGAVPFFGLAYILGKVWNTVEFCRRHTFWAICGVLGAFVFRFAMRAIMDGTIWYNNIVVPYTHYFSAFCTFIAASKLLDYQPWACAEWIGKVSFEVYLYHYMFIWPPLSVMSITDNWLLNCMIVLVCTFVLAAVMHRALEIVESILGIRRKIHS